MKFHDGTDFNAEAVCFNFDRWYNMPGVGADRRPDLLLRHPVPRLRDRRPRRRGDLRVLHRRRRATATIKLKKPFAGFISAMSLPAFSMQSPTGARGVPGRRGQQPAHHRVLHRRTRPAPVRSVRARGSAGSRSRSSATTTTGASRPRSTRRSSSRSTTRRPAPTRCATARSTATTWSGPPTSRRSRTRASRSSTGTPFNVLYLGMNQAVKPLDDIRVRQAIAHAINKDEIISASMPEGTEAAIEFIPPRSSTATPRTSRQYEYDPEKAKDLLAGGRRRRARPSSSTTRPASAGRTCRSRRTPST